MQSEAEKTLSREAEEDLVKLAQCGDRAAMAALYHAFAGRLYRQVIYPSIADVALAEDILKETFATAMEKLDTYTWNPAYGIFPWLARIARNRALDLHRRRQRESRGQGAYRDMLDQLAPSASAERLLSEEQEQKLLRERVRLLLGRLNPRYRQALVMRLFEEKSREDCATELDIKLGTFDVLLHRALLSFRRLWEEEEIRHDGERSEE
ncbi:MAG: RNA polymerase sigma factor [Myxococcales bacterium]|nr:RNA polymerase sigma factor [Myxococcales bacterium]MCB9643606.1 RNA polymerase sigma factor [Myxococcales bacterium]